MNAALGGLILTGATVAFGALATPSQALAAGPPSRAALTITVQNNRSVPVTLYVEHGAFDTPLGSVAADRESVLPLPRFVERGETVRIIVHPAVGEDLGTQEVTVPYGGTFGILVPEGESVALPRPHDMIPNPGPGTTTLTVKNPRTEPVTVVVEKGDIDTTLGTVAPNASETFKLASWLTVEPTDVRVFLDPRDGVEMSTPMFTLERLAHLEVKVPRI